MCSCIASCFKGCLDCMSKAVLMSLNGFFMMQGLVITVAMTVGFIIINGLTPESAEDLDWIVTVKNVVIAALSFGVIILFVSFLGCFGACMKIRCMLIAYALLLVGLIIAQMVLVIMAATGREDKERQVQEEWMGNLKNYTSADEHPRMEIDDLQKNEECCGVMSYMDWKENKELYLTFSVPDSCCNNATGTASPGCGTGVLNEDNPDKIYTNGCYDEVREKVMIWFQVTFYFMLGVIGIQAVLVFAAACLSMKVGKD